MLSTKLLIFIALQCDRLSAYLKKKQVPKKVIQPEPKVRKFQHTVPIFYSAKIKIQSIGPLSFAGPGGAPVDHLSAILPITYGHTGRIDFSSVVSYVREIAGQVTSGKLMKLPVGISKDVGATATVRVSQDLGGFISDFMLMLSEHKGVDLINIKDDTNFYHGDGNQISISIRLAPSVEIKPSLMQSTA